MQAKLIQIGSSRGVRLPKLLIEKYELEEAIEIVESPEGLLIKPARKPRENWEEAFKQCASQDSESFSDMANIKNDWDETEWEW